MYTDKKAADVNGHGFDKLDALMEWICLPLLALAAVIMGSLG